MKLFLKELCKFDKETIGKNPLRNVLRKGRRVSILSVCFGNFPFILATFRFVKLIKVEKQEFQSFAYLNLMLINIKIRERGV